MTSSPPKGPPPHIISLGDGRGEEFQYMNLWETQRGKSLIPMAQLRKSSGLAPDKTEDEISRERSTP